MADGAERVDVRGDGRIILYKRTHLKHPKWQARISVPKATGYKIVTTGTADLKEAERFALDLYEDLYLSVKAGGAIKARTFRQVFVEWERACGAPQPSGAVHPMKTTMDRVRNYALPHFGSMSIERIGTAEFSKFWEWRAVKYRRKPPSASTLKRERSSILALFKFAKQRGYLRELPETATPKAKLVRRSTFSLNEWRVFYSSARRWVKEGKHKATWRDRYVAQQTFLILANSGLRIGELRRLRWGDIQDQEGDGDPRRIARVRGKTGSREIVFQPGCERYLERLRSLRANELGSEPEPTDVVVCSKNGTAVASMKRSFESLMEYAGLPKDDTHGSRTIYSLRHFYATRRLANGISPYALAKQMGTSVEMLEKFYGHVITSDIARELTKGNQK